MAELDTARIKRNVGKMLSSGAPEADIDAYVAAEGATPEMLRGAASAPTTPTARSETDPNLQADALKQGMTSLVGGVGETSKQLTGNGQALIDWAARNAPQGYTPAGNKLKEGELSALPRAAVEGAPGLAADIGAATVGSKIGKVFGSKGRLLGGLAGGTLSYLMRNAGDSAKETAAAQGNEGDPTLAQKLRGYGTTAVESIPNTASLLLPGGRIAATGVKGAVDAAGRVATKAGVEAATEMSQEGIHQLGTRGEINDPKAILAAGATGAATQGAFSTPKGIRDTVGAVRERGTDTSAAAAVANRLSERSTPEEMSNTKTAGTAVSRVQSDVQRELGDMARNTEMSTEAANTLRAVQSGQHVSDADLAHIAHPAIAELAAQANILNRWQVDAGGRVEGGVTGFGKKLAKDRTFQLVAGAAGGYGALTSAPAIIASAPHAGAVLGAAYGGARALDYLTGKRSPVQAFTEKFADGTTATRPGSRAIDTQPLETELSSAVSDVNTAQRAADAEALSRQQARASRAGTAAVRSAVGEEVRSQNKTTRKDTQDIKQLLKQLAVSEKLRSRNMASAQRAGDVMEVEMAQALANRPAPPLALPAPAMRALPPPSIRMGDGVIRLGSQASGAPIAQPSPAPLRALPAPEQLPFAQPVGGPYTQSSDHTPDAPEPTRALPANVMKLLSYMPRIEKSAPAVARPVEAPADDMAIPAFLRRGEAPPVVRPQPVSAPAEIRPQPEAPTPSPAKSYEEYVAKWQKLGAKHSEVPASALAAELDIPDFLRRDKMEEKTGTPKVSSMTGVKKPDFSIEQISDGRFAVFTDGLSWSGSYKTRENAQRALNAFLSKTETKGPKKAVSKQAEDAAEEWTVEHDKAELKPFEAANAIADKWEADGKTFRTTREQFVGYLSRVLKDKVEVASKLSKQTGIDELKLRKTLWALKDRGAALAKIDQLSRIHKDHEDAIRSTLEPKVTKWWTK